MVRGARARRPVDRRHLLVEQLRRQQRADDLPPFPVHLSKRRLGFLDILYFFRVFNGFHTVFMGSFYGFSSVYRGS